MTVVEPYTHPAVTLSLPLFMIDLGVYRLNGEEFLVEVKIVINFTVLGLQLLVARLRNIFDLELTFFQKENQVLMQHLFLVTVCCNHLPKFCAVEILLLLIIISLF